jgi:hypothetical protein
MLSYPMVLGGSLIGILGLVVIVFAVTGSFFATLVVIALAGVVGYVLYTYGYIKIDTSSDGIDIKFMETSPAPTPTKTIIPAGMPIEKKEVFYISGSNYTYEEAPAVCAAYEADLATYDQVQEAYSGGAEWCGYGWTQGGMALFPTQESTWETLQQESDQSKRTACGRPGVNGGYFDTKTKFGVNCYGVKPGDKGTEKYPLPVPGTDNAAFNNMVNKFKSMINRITVSPFNRDGWSEYNVASHTGNLAKKI